MSRTIAIIQQRLGNTRLKNKALLPLCGIPMTQHIVDRCKRAKLVNEVAVACPFKDAIVLGEALDATIVAPDVPENDLIARYYTVAKGMGADVAIRISGDNPCIEPEEIDALLAPVRAGECEMAIGSRFLAGGGYEGSGWRRAGTRFLSWVCRLVTGQRITDATSGFRAFGPRALRYLASYYPADYPEPEAIVLLSRRGLPIREVPVRMRPRQAGQSSISGLRTVYYMAKVSLSLLLAVFKEGPTRQAA